MPGYLEPVDLLFIDNEKLAASDGAVVVDGGKIRQLPTIVPQQKENGECVFFDSGRCSIHEHSPFGCRSFNACIKELTAEQEAERHRVLREIANDQDQHGPYQQTWRLLPQARPRAERLARYNALTRRIERQKAKSR